MAVWAVLLVMQIRVLPKPRDRPQLKVHPRRLRWLLVSMHAPILSGLRRADPPGLFPRFHGFVPACLQVASQHDDSGVSSRWCHLAGVDSKRISLLWACSSF